MEVNKLRKRLVVDPDPVFANTLQAESLKASGTLIVVKNGKLAQLNLSDLHQSFAAIFVNPELPGGYGLSVVRFAHRYRPATPIYFLVNGSKEPYTQKELHQLGVQGYLAKPATYANFMEFPKAEPPKFDSELAIDLAARNADALDMEVGADDSAFLSILAEHFLSGSTSFFDIYVKLSSGRYVKILKAGDSFSADRISTYLKKGVVHFYLRKEAQEIYLNYCEKLARAITKSDKIDSKIQITHTLNHGQEVMKYLEHQGVNQSYLNYATQFTGNVKELMARTRPKDNPYVDQFLADIGAFEHAVGVTMIASVLGNALGISGANPLQLIGMSGMLHDVGLLQLPKDLRHEDTSQMTEQQKRVFYNHPVLGAEVLRSFREVDPTAIQAIVQHHERRNKLGFPNRLGTGMINRVSELIGLSDDLMLFLQRSKTKPEIKPIEEVLRTLSANFSFPVGEAFKTVFKVKQL